METLMKRALDIAHLFDVPRGEMACEPYGTGNINDTFCLTVRPWTGAVRRYILQRVNRYVFPDPEPMMGNIQRVTHYLRGVIARGGGDPARETLTLVRAMDGRPWITDASGDLVARLPIHWREPFQPICRTAGDVCCGGRGVRTVPAPAGGI